MSEETKRVVEKFFSKHPARHVRKGEVLLRSHSVVDGVFYLQSGMVNLVSTSPKGEEIVLNVFKPGSFFPVQAILAQEEWQSDFSFQVAEDAVLAKASLAEAQEFLHSHPDVTYDLLARIYRGIDGLFHRVAQLMAGSARERIVQELLIRAQRFGVHKEGAVTFSLSEKELAALAGVTRETVSRVLSDLKREELAQYAQQKITLFDLKKLEREVSS